MRKIFFILSVFFSLASSAQITFFGVATKPADNTTNAASGTVSVTPPGSMVVGDLVVMIMDNRIASFTPAISADGGQSWTTFSAMNTTNFSGMVAWCRYNGTWSADPSFTTSGTNAASVQMLVFRPTTGTNVWAVDNAFSSTAISGTGAKTITGVTTTAASTVAIGIWLSQGTSNTWGTLSGTGWVQTSLGAQYRNTSGNVISNAYAYQIKTSAGATNNVSLTPSGTAVGFTAIVTFKESAPPAFKQGFMF